MNRPPINVDFKLLSLAKRSAPAFSNAPLVPARPQQNPHMGIEAMISEEIEGDDLLTKAAPAPAYKLRMKRAVSHCFTSRPCLPDQDQDAPHPPNEPIRLNIPIQPKKTESEWKDIPPSRRKRAQSTCYTASNNRYRGPRDGGGNSQAFFAEFRKPRAPSNAPANAQPPSADSEKAKPADTDAKSFGTLLLAPISEEDLAHDIAIMKRILERRGRSTRGNRAGQAPTANRPTKQQDKRCPAQSDVSALVASVGKATRDFFSTTADSVAGCFAVLNALPRKGKDPAPKRDPVDTRLFDIYSKLSVWPNLHALQIPEDVTTLERYIEFLETYIAHGSARRDPAA